MLRLSLVVVALLAAACGTPAGSAPPSAATNPAPTAAATASPTSAPTEPAATAPSVGAGEPWIVYQGAPLGLSLIRPDGTGNHVILGPPGDQVHPDWSPDGGQIAYVQVTDSAQVLMLTDPRGAAAPLFATVPPELENLFLDNPAWSRDGTRIAAVAYEGSPQQTLPTSSKLVVVEVETGDVTIVHELQSGADTSLHSFPRWSPDGRALVFVLDQFDGEEYVGGQVAVVRESDGTWSEPDPITETLDPPRVDWHPVDDLIVYCTNDVGSVETSEDASNLFTIRSDGSGLTPVTTFAAGAERASQPTWTSDGRIIFDLITGSNDERGSIAFINADSSDLEVVVETSFIGLGNRPHPRLRPAP